MEKSYENLSKISVAGKTEKKGKFSYLSWAWAWHILQTNYPGSKRVVYEDENGVPYFNDGKYANVKVGVIVNGVEHIDYMPVTDHVNRSIPYAKINSFDINNSIQRSTAKAIAMHGLGLSLWIGEDTSRIPNEDIKPAEVTPEVPLGEYHLEVDGENWERVLNFVVKNKSQGMPFIVSELKKKYKDKLFQKNTKVFKQLEKEVNG
tara:strand:+ start:773 stop:1387 length:615 start_codon:yes stop_codon:yes gene_type:complete